MGLLNSFWMWFAADFPSWGWVLFFAGAGFFGANVVIYDITRHEKDTDVARIAERIMTFGLPKAPEAVFAICYFVLCIWCYPAVAIAGFGAVPLDGPYLFDAEFRALILGIAAYVFLWTMRFALRRGRMLIVYRRS